jgi:hypothetical protein
VRSSPGASTLAGPHQSPCPARNPTLSAASQSISHQRAIHILLLFGEKVPEGRMRGIHIWLRAADQSQISPPKSFRASSPPPGGIRTTKNLSCRLEESLLSLKRQIVTSPAKRVLLTNDREMDINALSEDETRRRSNLAWSDRRQLLIEHLIWPTAGHISPCPRFFYQPRASYQSVLLFLELETHLPSKY